MLQIERGISEEIPFLNRAFLALLKNWKNKGQVDRFGFRFQKIVFGDGINGLAASVACIPRPFDLR